MKRMKISMLDSLKQFVDEQVARRGHGTRSEYVRRLIRKEADRIHLRSFLLDGAASVPMQAVDAAYFDSLKRRVRRQVRG